MKVNWSVLWLAFTWWWLETQFFGWNAMPRSTEELFADGGALLIAALAFMQTGCVTVVIRSGDDE